jgi:ADP-ribose diphosphatase
MKVIGKKDMWQGKFLRAVLIKYSDLQSGVTPDKEVVRDWEAVERVNCGGIAAIVPVRDNGSVLLIRQFRPPVNGFVVELPAGLAAPGEPLAEAARRELTEETGYSAQEMNFLTEGPLSSGLSSEILGVFLATGLTFTGITNRDETEDIEVFEVPLDGLYSELAAMRSRGDYIDLKIYGLIELAKEFMRSGKES